MKALSSALIAAALLACIGAARAGPVGAYICAVDNCGKKYLDIGQGAADACKTGVEGADRTPSNPDCLKMCEADFGPKGKSLIAACKTGCGMFPSECLRNGNVPPPDPQLNRPRTERYAPQPARPPQQPRRRDYYRY